MTDKELFIICFHIALGTISWVLYWVLAVFVMVVLLAGVASGLGYLSKKLRG